MKYGMIIKDIKGLTTFKELNGIKGGTVFRFDSISHENFSGHSTYEDLKMEDGSIVEHCLSAKHCVEISEAEYKRLKGEVHSDISPELQKVLEEGDWGCQEEAVRKAFEVITKMVKEVK